MNNERILEFIEILKNKPDEAYDFICNNYNELSKTELVNIIKELLYSIYYHCRNDEDIYNQIMKDASLNLEDRIY